MTTGGVDASLSKLRCGNGLHRLGVAGLGELPGRARRHVNDVLGRLADAGESVQLGEGVEVLAAACGGFGPDDVGQGRDLDLDPADDEGRGIGVQVLVAGGAGGREVEVELAVGGDQVEHAHAAQGFS